jgi:tetratricopeptide (TPR) repeat protein
MASGDYARAASIYGELSRLHPAEPGLKLNAGLALFSAGRYAEAEPNFVAFLISNRNHAPAQLMLGMTRLKRNRPCEALQPLTAANSLSRNQPKVLLELGSACLECGRTPEAVRHFEELSRLTPQSPRAWFALGSAYLKAERRAEAYSAFSRLAGLPDSGELHELLAESAHLQGKHEEAIAEWDKAIRLLPGDGRLPRLRARGLWRAGRYEEAALALQRLRNPESPEATLEYELGDCVYRLEGAEAAVPILTRSVALAPELIPARAALGRALLETGDAKGAIAHLEAAARSGIDPSVWMALSNAYRLTGRPREAAAAAQRAQSELNAKP